jgi:ATP/maltotriose-dependent transcriptional regulator MalT
MSLLYGPTPVGQAIRQCESLLSQDLVDRQVRAVIMCKVAHLRAMNQEFDEARSLYRNARKLLAELGRGVQAAQTGSDVLSVEMLAGDLAAAEREAKIDLAFLADSGETFFLASLSGLLARVVREQGRHDEAMDLTRQAEAAAADDDWDAQTLWRAVRAPILAEAGDRAQAEQLIATALESASSVDDPMLRADTIFEAARVKRFSGDFEASKALVGEASAICIAKGNKAALARISTWTTQVLGS